MDSISCRLLGIFFIIIFVFVDSTNGDDLKVTVKQGALKGHRLKSRSGRDILAFQGIPYAKPPIGELRFKPSEPASAWSGVLDASKEGPACIQRDIFFNVGAIYGEEDCLHLNVYTPKVKTTKPLAVMVWIHGGGWFSGSSGTEVFGPQFLLDKDIVLVSLNYRLGPLGFLSTEDSVCPGNNGLKDQTLALKWVRDNIAQFGGDPNKVTIFGESAGGASTHYHMISPMSKGLFHASISQSGSVLGPWAIAPKNEGKARAKKLATLFDCPTDSSSKLVDCLRTKDAQEIIETDHHFREWGIDPIVVFRPVVEGKGVDAFIPDDPIELLQKASSIADVPWMTGITSGEGALCVPDIIKSETLLNDLNTDFSRIAPLTMLYRDVSPAPHFVSEKVKQFYFNKKAIGSDNFMGLVDMYTDSYFLHPADSSVRIISKLKSAPVFYYLFDYKGSSTYSTVFGGDPKIDYGVAHCDELQYLFPHEKIFPDVKMSKHDLKMVDILTTLWTDFAKNGHPTPEGSALPKWDRVKKPEVEYLHIGPKAEISMKANLLAKRREFWAALPISSQPYSIRDEL